MRAAGFEPRTVLVSVRVSATAAFEGSNGLSTLARQAEGSNELSTLPPHFEGSNGLSTLAPSVEGSNNNNNLGI